MNQVGDHNGELYPEPGKDTEWDLVPSHAEIAARAYQLWLEQGQPANCAEHNWLEAERELKASLVSKSLVEKVYARAGSEQA